MEEITNLHKSLENDRNKNSTLCNEMSSMKGFLAKTEQEVAETQQNFQKVSSAFANSERHRKSLQVQVSCRIQCLITKIIIGKKTFAEFFL